MRSSPGRTRCPVLVVSRPSDPHARAVVEALKARRVPALMIDTARFPERMRLGLTFPNHRQGWRGRLRLSSAADLDPFSARSVWWRRPHPFQLHIDDEARWGGIYCACQAALGAFWKSLDALWVNSPEADLAADHKPSQLAIAHRLGLAIPRSCITNDPAIARAFILERPEGETIHKNVTSAPSLGQPTHVSRLNDRDLFSSLRTFPRLFQERVRAVSDLRVTFVGEQIFPAEIDFPDGRHFVDWRTRLARIRARPTRLSDREEERLRRLIRQLGLHYAAIDLRRKENGELVFLEVNPAGQWLFVENQTGQKITAALAQLLALR